MKQLPIERARQEIDDGLASVTAALGDPSAVAPFFRIPGLSRAETAEDYLASNAIQTWKRELSISVSSRSRSRKLTRIPC
jgi:hypothetical protein